MHPLAEGVIRAEPRAVGRVCRLVDDTTGDYRTILEQLFPHTGRAWTIGVTGAPGAGKSTLVDRLIEAFRAESKRVGVVAVDPSSPFSGGAILGDRIRMQRHYADPGVFIRSVATRGSLGGLSRTTTDIVRVLDAAGSDVVIVETVGVGQDELEVSRTVDTTLVVLAPGMGDEVQAFKAGLLECADVFVVNKADRDGADAAARQIELMIALGHETGIIAPATAHHGPAPGTLAGKGGATAAGERGRPPDALARWTAPIVRAIATQGTGIAALRDGLEQHRKWLVETDAGQRRRVARLREAIHNQLRNTLLDCVVGEMAEALEAAVHAIARREADPYRVTDQLISAFRRRDRCSGA